MNAIVKVVGVGVILETQDRSYLFQKRDRRTERSPGRITPFGGGAEEGESLRECALREIREELELDASDFKMAEIGVFESHYKPGTHIQMYLLKNIDPSLLTLHEGSHIVGFTYADAQTSSEVTDFTKEVLRFMHSN